MNTLQYAIAEGFVAIFYWYDKMQKKFVSRIGTDRQAGAEMIFKNEQWIFIVRGVKYVMDDNFHMDYGVLVNDYIEGNDLCTKWLLDRDNMITYFYQVVAPQIEQPKVPQTAAQKLALEKLFQMIEDSEL
jgi:hypothetical protein